MAVTRRFRVASVFVSVAYALNRWENYRTTVDFERQLVHKLFAFFFVDGFLWSATRDRHAEASCHRHAATMSANAYACTMWPQCSRHAADTC